MDGDCNFLHTIRYQQSPSGIALGPEIRGRRRFGLWQRGPRPFNAKQTGSSNKELDIHLPHDAYHL